ncbi:MAG: hypothetical protein V4631_20640 [Pseudomonadota bacterium]
MAMLMESAACSWDGTRERFVDDLNALIVEGAVSQGEQAYIVERLLEEIEHEDDTATCGYIFGLLVSMRANGVSAQTVTDGVAQRLHALRPAGQAYAIALIGSSNRADKMVVLAPLMVSPDAAVRNAIAELLHSSGR